MLGRGPGRTAAGAWKAQLGIVLQSGAGDSQLTCREMLQAQASYYADPRDPDEVLELVGLTEKAGVRGQDPVRRAAAPARRRARHRRPARRCCSWTSRRPASTRRRAGSSGR